MLAPERLQRVEELFHAALELPPSERKAFLRVTCGGQDSLRREIELLLAEDALGSGLLRTGLGRGPAAGSALAAGTRIGHYVISGVIGAGGMGEVYRASDARLKREVAVKVLPESLAGDSERIGRFRREAQLLASLNHAHIATIYALEESEYGLALVLELVEGPTLAERIASGPVPLDEALEIGRQIGEALEAAHERGIIHRDLKPANVKIAPDGTVKVLDFGLAKMLERPAEDAAVSTLSLSATRVGLILGTAAYMAPEQARGAAVDKRADIWAFGVVLYEMLTARRPFAGETISEIMAAVLGKEVEWDGVPEKMQPLMRRCLEKDPKRRLRDIADGWLLLEAAPGTAPAKRRPSWAVATLVVLVVVLSFWAGGRGRRPAERPLQPLVRLDSDLGGNVSLASSAGTDLVLSPDGSRLVYCSRSRLFTRRLNETTVTELPGTEGASAPFFSPDSQWVGFFVLEALKKISVQGGGTTTLCKLPAGRGGSWGEDGFIVAASGSSGLFRVGAGGGTPVPLTELAPPGEYRHRWPQVLSGGKAVLFTAFTSQLDSKIDVMTVKDRRRKTVQQGATYARVVPTGHLVYLDRGTLFAAPFDLDRLEVRGPSVPLLEQVASSLFNGVQFDFGGPPSGPGIAAYRSGNSNVTKSVEWLDSAGNSRPLPLEAGHYSHVHLSRDGNELALVENADIRVYDLRRQTNRQLTFGSGHRYPIWTADGRYLIFSASGGMYFMRADGGTKPQPLTQSKDIQYPWSITDDGKHLAFEEINHETGQTTLKTVALENDATGPRAGRPATFLEGPFDAHCPSLSPDGKWLAYASNESGSYQTWVRPFPNTGGKWVISGASAAFPEWSRKGRELFFRTLDNRIMVVGYTVKGDSFQPAGPRLWSAAAHSIGQILMREYDIAPDGKHVIALVPVTGGRDEAPSRVTFLMNFFDELRRRAPSP